MTNSLSADITVTGRIMYPHLFQAHKFHEGDDPQFRCSVVIEQGDPQVGNIWNLVQQIVAAELGGVQPDAANQPLKTEANNEAVAGMYVIRPKSNQAPAVYQRDAAGNFQQLQDPNLIQDGDWVAVSMRLFKYDAKGNRGVSAALNSVLYLGKGPGRLGKSGGPDAQTAFGAVQLPPGVAAPAIGPGVATALPAAAPAQPQYQPPAAPAAAPAGQVPQFPPQQ